jgi:hypothetical protein
MRVLSVLRQAAEDGQVTLFALYDNVNTLVVLENRGRFR